MIVSYILDFFNISNLNYRIVILIIIVIVDDSSMKENVNFVDKGINPPNVPQARPIENFWGWLVQKVYEGGWEAKTEQQLIRRIES